MQVGRILRGVLPALRAGLIWQLPLARAALRQSGDPALPADMLTLAGRLTRALISMTADIIATGPESANGT